MICYTSVYYIFDIAFTPKYTNLKLIGTVDVRILVLGLKGDTDYTAEVIPDHNPPTSVTTTTDYEGIFWAVAKIPNGEKSLLFNVNLYEGNDIDGDVVVSGDDDAPCHSLPLFEE